MAAPGLNRRRWLATLGSAAAVAAVSRPYLSRAADRPLITHGVQSGDVSTDSGIVWARADRAARMMVEVSTTDSFTTIVGGASVDALPDSDFTAKTLLQGLPAGQDIFYRIRFADIGSPTILGEPVTGRFRTAPADRRSVSFVWSGDTAGQGWGIDPARGGMRMYATMRGNRPDFFIHSGDTIYADAPIAAEVKLPDGTLWRNLVTEEKSKPAETLAEFRGAFKYNLMDKNLLAFNAEIPMFAQWDDHEVTNNWWPGEDLSGAKHRRLRYTENSASILASRGGRAFLEYIPIRASAGRDRIFRKIGYGPLLDVFMLDMRSYRGPNGEGREDAYGPAAHLLGPEQTAWLKRELQSSRATWKVIAADQPLGLIVHEDFVRQWGVEAVAQGMDGPPRGRELEVADLLAFIKRAGIRNTVWLTADVHHTAAHYYDPDKAVFQDFEPFWEFVSGPIHAGSFPRGELDNTFGPQLIYAKAPTSEQGVNQSPATEFQFFGHVAIDGASGVMTVTLKDINDRALWSTRLEPKAG